MLQPTIRLLAWPSLLTTSVPARSSPPRPSALQQLPAVFSELKISSLLVPEYDKRFYDTAVEEVAHGYEACVAR